MPRRDPPPPAIVPVPPSIDRVRRALGGGRPPKPPGRITQIAFDFDDAHLRALADPRAAVTSIHAYDYALDLCYTPIQRDLFVFAFPRLLEQYRHELLHGAQSMFPAQFEAALSYTNLLGQYSNPLGGRKPAAKYPNPLEGSPEAQHEANLYLAGTILEFIDRIDRLTAPDAPREWHEAVGHIALFGIYSPTIEPLWRSWWSFETRGRLCLGLLWLSCLVYDEAANPFWPCPAAQESRPPALWCDHGFVFHLDWKPANIDFLRTTLTPRFVQEAAAWGLQRLEGTEDELAAAILVSDIAARHEVVASRIAELPGLLALPNEPADEHRRWTI